MLSRLLEAHEIVIAKTRDAIEATARNGDAGHQRPAHERRTAAQRAAGLVHRRASRRATLTVLYPLWMIARRRHQPNRPCT